TQLRDPTTPAPTAADGSGRSAQTFLMEVVAQRGASERRASARGRDIYAVTGPLVVEALERILDGRSARAGTMAPGELLDARAMLAALSPEPLVVEYAP
ncbi:MAG TPA: hypothetical protein VFO83_06510, partial [Aggregicoccus sp.]|nr:hypothetical protein [Aggregicoccus sp.]